MVNAPASSIRPLAISVQLIPPILPKASPIIPRDAATIRTDAADSKVDGGRRYRAAAISPSATPIAIRPLAIVCESRFPNLSMESPIKPSDDATIRTPAAEKTDDGGIRYSAPPIAARAPANEMRPFAISVQENSENSLIGSTNSLIPVARRTMPAP